VDAAPAAEGGKNVAALEPRYLTAWGLWEDRLSRAFFQNSASSFLAVVVETAQSRRKVAKTI
jgi:hypothetical protein